ncbi:MAG: hypothetical protein BA863_10855 [Desulfovibrio sp. S3730MH75]|nr:MAG: hypothetical protein BA863_10855 [Desulfovibrio sp. S3730MH75]
MAYFKFKTYFFFFALLWLSFGGLFIIKNGMYIHACLWFLAIGAFSYLTQHNCTLGYVEEDSVAIRFAFFKKIILFIDIKEVELVEISRWNAPKTVGVFSIRTVKNKFYEAYYSIPSGAFEKIQEGVAKAQLQMGSSNTPE